MSPTIEYAVTRHLSSTRRGIAGGFCGALASGLLAVTATPANAAERVVMRLDDFGQDIAFVDRYLKRKWPLYTIQTNPSTGRS